MDISKISEGIIEDLIKETLFDIGELKKEPKNDWNIGKMLAYFECLTKVQRGLMPFEEQFGLDGDLEEKYGLNEYLNRKD